MATSLAMWACVLVAVLAAAPGVRADTAAISDCTVAYATNSSAAGTPVGKCEALDAFRACLTVALADVDPESTEHADALALISSFRQALTSTGVSCNGHTVEAVGEDMVVSAPRDLVVQVGGLVGKARTWSGVVKAVDDGASALQRQDSELEAGRWAVGNLTAATARQDAALASTRWMVGNLTESLGRVNASSTAGDAALVSALDAVEVDVLGRVAALASASQARALRVDGNLSDLVGAIAAAEVAAGAAVATERLRVDAAVQRIADLEAASTQLNKTLAAATAVTGSFADPQQTVTVAGNLLVQGTTRLAGSVVASSISVPTWSCIHNGATHSCRELTSASVLGLRSTSIAPRAVGPLYAFSIGAEQFLQWRGLTAYWSFDGTDPTLPDFGQARGKVEGYSQAVDATSSVVPFVGFGLSASFNNDEATRFVMEESPLLGMRFTIAFWAYHVSCSNNQIPIVLTNAAGANAGHVGDFRHLASFVANGKKTGTTANTCASTLFEWHHKVYTSNGTDVAIYLDGKLIAPDQTNAKPADYQGLRIGGFGSFPGFGTNGIHGYLDEVAQFDRAVTAGEVEAMWNCHGHGFRWTPKAHRISDEGLQAYWNFDETSDPTVAEIGGFRGRLDGYTNPATATSTDVVTSGFQNAATFSNNEVDRYYIESGPVFGSTYTVAFWGKHTSCSNNQILLWFADASGNSINAGMQDSRYLGAIFGPGITLYRIGTTADCSKYLNTWNHYVYSSTATATTFYFNGQAMPTVAGSDARVDLKGLSVEYFGSKPGASTNGYSGNVDEVLLFKRAISSLEASTLAGKTVFRLVPTAIVQGFVVDPAGLQGYWNFDTSTPTTATFGSYTGRQDGRSYPSSVSSSLPFASPAFGKSASWDNNENTRFRIFNGPRLGAKWTLSYWAQHTTCSNNQIPVYFNSDTGEGSNAVFIGDDYHYASIYSYAAGRYLFGLHNSKPTTCQQRLNSWHHHLYIDTGSAYEVYMDGVKLNPTDHYSYTSISGLYLAWFGCRPGFGTNGLGGYFDDFGMWERALTPQEGLEIFNGGRKNLPLSRLLGL